MNKLTFYEKIKASWDSHDDDDVSTERLLQMVADDCNCDIEDVVETLGQHLDENE